MNTLLALGLFLSRSEETTAKGVAATRDLAIASALKHAVAQVAGEWVESRFSHESKEAQGVFSQKVEDTIRVDTAGFVETYKITSEGKTADGYEVVVSARVNTKKLTSLMEGLAAAIEKHGRKPRVAMVVKDDMALAGAFVQAQLVAAGLDVVEKDADVTLFVDASYKNLGVIKDAEFEALNGQTRSEVKLLLRSEMTRSKKVLSTKPVVMTSVGTDYNRSLQRALQGSGNNAIKIACDDFFTRLKDMLDAPPPKAMTVTVRKVASYKSQAKPLMALMGQVARVEEKAFNGGELTLSVEGEGWEKTFFEQCESQKWCKTLDKLGGDTTTLLLSF